MLNMNLFFRADLKKFVGLPGAKAVAGMLEGSVEELVSKGLVSPVAAPSLDPVAAACASAGLSGRAVRKLPFLALAQGRVRRAETPVDGERFVGMLAAAVETQKKDKDKLN